MSVCMAVNVEDGINVGAILDGKLRELGMSHKEAAIGIGIQESKLTEGIRGERPLDLWKLRLLPIRFWQAFLPALASALIEQWLDDLQVPYRMARAELRESRKEKVS